MESADSSSIAESCSGSESTSQADVSTSQASNESSLEAYSLAELLPVFDGHGTDSNSQDPGEGTSALPSSQASTSNVTTATESEQSSNVQSSTNRRMDRVRRRWRTPGRYLLGGVRGPVPVKGQSFCDCPKECREIVCKCGEEDNAFDWTWDKDSKSSATELSDSLRDVRFHVNYSSGTAAVRSNKQLIDRQCFWEIKMTTPVYGTDMMVGVGTPAVDLDACRHNFCSLLGRDGESWGLSYYGRVQHKSQFKTIVGAKFGQGTIIGAHLDMWHGTLSFYKNRRPLGVVYRGLAGKTLYPMLSSTAARTGMRLTKSCSFQTSLQFFCCQVLRKMVPSHLDVTQALDLPPGLQAFLDNNLSWLLRPSELSSEARRKRKHSRSRSDSEDDSSDEDISYKRVRTAASSDEEGDV